ncbi:MAG: hypothetical protein ACK4ME_08520 [Fimbriimonadales bacterium]
MKQHTTIARNALGLFATVALTLSALFSPTRSDAQISYQVWLSADDASEVYYGTSTKSRGTVHVPPAAVTADGGGFCLMMCFSRERDAGGLTTHPHIVRIRI